MINPRNDNNVIVTMTRGELYDLMAMAACEGARMAIKADRESREQVTGKADIAAVMGISMRTLDRRISEGRMDGIVRRNGRHLVATRGALEDVNISLTTKKNSIYGKQQSDQEPCRS